jgi:hypothetical protein
MPSVLATYEEFIARVETLGFMPLSLILSGFPSLGGETAEDRWHTGLETDPWRWKDRAAQEKRLAYGCILGGHKGFVTRRMYPYFYAAYHPTTPMPDRWAAGTVNQMTWRIWQLFEECDTFNISQVRQALGVSRKQGASAADSAIQKLQHEYYITVDGNERKLNASGEPYGWAVNRYRRVVEWAPVGWLDGAQAWGAADAAEEIVNAGLAMARGVNRQDLAKKLGFG